jgi:hypothetical protein
MEIDRSPTEPYYTNDRITNPWPIYAIDGRSAIRRIAEFLFKKRPELRVVHLALGAYRTQATTSESSVAETTPKKDFLASYWQLIGTVVLPKSCGSF